MSYIGPRSIQGQEQPFGVSGEYQPPRSSTIQGRTWSSKSPQEKTTSIIGKLFNTIISALAKVIRPSTTTTEKTRKRQKTARRKHLRGATARHPAAPIGGRPRSATAKGPAAPIGGRPKALEADVPRQRAPRSLKEARTQAQNLEAEVKELSQEPASTEPGKPPEPTTRIRRFKAVPNPQSPTGRRTREDITNQWNKIYGKPRREEESGRKVKFRKSHLL